MGAYSSWAVFSLTHHLVVAYAAKRCGFQLGSFTNYILLGDDIVIKDDRVAQVYVSIMTRLGVNISTYKTHVSKDTYEFAKRWIKAGSEITGLPLKGIGSNLKNYKVTFMLLYSYFERIPSLQKGVLSDLVAKLYSGFFLPRKGSVNNPPEDGLMKASTAPSPKARVRKGIYLTFTKVKRELDIMSVGVKFSKGILTYDEARRVLMSYISYTASFMFPGEGEFNQ
jgi:hypothetical protein